MKENTQPAIVEEPSEGRNPQSADEEVLVRVEHVSKRFCRNLKRSLWYGLQDMTGEITGRNKKGILRKDEFWAVKDVNFELRRGECLGLIGHNGAGKSTLLKMLNGLIKPDQGRIEMRGRIGALIELGAGFNPVLTGRENVYINGQILGFTKKEIDEKYEAIVAFSELQDFMEAPVQSYSSGMKVRLGFAVAAQMEPDILIIDEVLAVGDMKFVLKCFNLVEKLIKRCTVIFVSHNLPQVSRICSKAILLDHGVIKENSDDVSKVLDSYYAQHKSGIPSFGDSNGAIEIQEILINGQNAREFPMLNRLEEMDILFKIKISPEYKTLKPALVFYNQELRNIAEYIIEDDFVLTNDASLVMFKVKFEKILFSKGIYSLTLVLSDSHTKQILLRAQSLASFQVSAERNIWTSFQLSGKIEQL